jgi:hypothetical protein
LGDEAVTGILVRSPALEELVRLANLGLVTAGLQQVAAMRGANWSFEAAGDDGSKDANPVAEVNEITSGLVGGHPTLKNLALQPINPPGFNFPPPLESPSPLYTKKISDWPLLDRFVCKTCGDTARRNPEVKRIWGCARCNGWTYSIVLNFRLATPGEMVGKRMQERIEKELADPPVTDYPLRNCRCSPTPIKPATDYPRYLVPIETEVMPQFLIAGTPTEEEVRKKMADSLCVPKALFGTEVVVTDDPKDAGDPIYGTFGLSDGPADIIVNIETIPEEKPENLPRGGFF